MSNQRMKAAQIDHIDFNYVEDKKKDKYANAVAKQDNIKNLANFMGENPEKRQIAAPQVNNMFGAEDQLQPAPNRRYKAPETHISLDQNQIIKDELAKQQENMYSKAAPVSLFEKPTIQPSSKKHFNSKEPNRLTSQSGIRWESEEIKEQPRRKNNQDYVTNNMFLHGQKEDIKWK